MERNIKLKADTNSKELSDIEIWNDTQSKPYQEGNQIYIKEIFNIKKYI